MKICYIMRGVPGSCKSTVAKKLHAQSPYTVIHSTDNYFLGTDNVYRFDPTKLPEFHEKNLEAFKASVARGVGVVICDNTNSKREHYAPYVECAERAGYLVVIVMCIHPDPAIAAARNIHGVPEPAIRRMIEQWEY